MNPRRLASAARVLAARCSGRLLLGTVLVFGPVAASAASLTALGDLPGGAYRSEFGALSADGGTVVGWSTSANGKEAFRWSLAGGMTGLGDLAGGTFESAATAVSADGSVVVGNSISASGPEAFRWTAAGGLAGLGALSEGGSFYSIASGISADGSVVVGTSFAADGAKPFRWTAASGMAGLAGINGVQIPRVTPRVSDDGDTVAGGEPYRAFRWIAPGDKIWRGEGIPNPGPEGYATAVSADGGVVVGVFGVSVPFSPGITLEGFRLATIGGTDVVTRLGLLDGSLSCEALAVSADGSTVVGQCTIGGSQTFRWTPATGMVGIGSIGSPTSVSADGNTVVTTSGMETFVWTAANGAKSLKAVLLAKGIDPASAGWTALATDPAQRGYGTSGTAVISRDGRYVAGTGIRNGNTEAYLADLQAVVVPPPVVTATFAGGAVTLRWDPTFSAVQQVQRAAKPEGPYTQVASGALAGSYTETPPAGAGAYYRIVWP